MASNLLQIRLLVRLILLLAHFLKLLSKAVITCAMHAIKTVPHGRAAMSQLIRLSTV